MQPAPIACSDCEEPAGAPARPFPRRAAPADGFKQQLRPAQRFDHSPAPLPTRRQPAQEFACKPVHDPATWASLLHACRISCGQQGRPERPTARRFEHQGSGRHARWAAQGRCAPVRSIIRVVRSLGEAPKWLLSLSMAITATRQRQNSFDLPFPGPSSANPPLSVQPHPLHGLRACKLRPLRGAAAAAPRAAGGARGRTGHMSVCCAIRMARSGASATRCPQQRTPGQRI